MELEIEFSIENILFVILFIYCIYLLFFSFSNPKQEGLSVSSGKKSKSKKSDDDEDGGDAKDGDDGGHDGGDAKDGDDNKTYQTASPSDTKDEPDNGIAEKSAHYAKTLKHQKENYLSNLKIPKYKDNYKKLINKISDNTELLNLDLALSRGFIFYGNKDELLNTIDKYS